MNAARCFGRGLQSGIGNRGIAVDADAIGAVVQALQRGVDRVEFGKLVLIECKFQIACGVDLGGRIFAVGEMLGGHFGTADLAAALIGNLRQQLGALGLQKLKKSVCLHVNSQFKVDEPIIASTLRVFLDRGQSQPKLWTMNRKEFVHDIDTH